MSVHQPVTIGHYTHCANCLEAWPCDTRQHQQGRQLAWSITDVRNMVEHYADHIDLHWFCLPMKLRNGVSNFEPTWTAWDPEKEDMWVRPRPDIAIGPDDRRYDWYEPGMMLDIPDAPEGGHGSEVGVTATRAERGQPK